MPPEAPQRPLLGSGLGDANAVSPTAAHCYEVPTRRLGVTVLRIDAFMLPSQSGCATAGYHGVAYPASDLRHRGALERARRLPCRQLLALPGISQKMAIPQVLPEKADIGGTSASLPRHATPTIASLSRSRGRGMKLSPASRAGIGLIIPRPAMDADLAPIG
jgi:hypothetical protein